MKPRLGRTVYCIYEDSILEEPVFALAENSFLIYPYDRYDDSWEWYFEDYEETWFTSDDYYELQEQEWKWKE